MGGDVRVSGVGPDGGAWTVAIEHPWATGPVALVGLAEGAIATSTTLLRTWTAGGTARHHLIDPATGEPSDTDLNLVSIVAGQAWIAEVLAKAVLLRGAERAFDLLDPSVANALTVDRDGTVRATPGLGAHLGQARLPERLAGAHPTDNDPRCTIEEITS
jgi:thiamine biosynthesis lipoprotein